MTNDTVNDSIKWTKWNYIALKHNHCYAIMQVTSFPLFFLWGDRGSRGWYDNPQTALRPLLRHGPLCNPGVCKLSACECCAALSRDRHIMCIESLVLYVHSFYRAAYMQGGLSHCKGVCPSVRPSVTRVNCDKTNESSAEIFIPNERQIHVVFQTQRMVGWWRPLLPEILGRTDPPSFKNGNFHSIFARSSSTVGDSEKSSIITNRSSVRAFQWA